MNWKIIVQLFFLLSLISLPAHPNNATSIQQKNPEVSQSVNQFLNLWLIKQSRKQAQKFLSPSPIACFSADENIRSQEAVRQLFSTVLSTANQELGKRRSLEDAIESFRLGNKKKYKEIEHSAKAAYSISSIPSEEIGTYLCKTDLAKLSKRGVDTQNLFLVTFTFKVPEDKKGGLLFIWAKEKNVWRILTFDALSF